MQIVHTRIKLCAVASGQAQFDFENKLAPIYIQCACMHMYELMRSSYVSLDIFYQDGGSAVPWETESVVLMWFNFRLFTSYFKTYSTIFVGDIAICLRFLLEEHFDD